MQDIAQIDITFSTKDVTILSYIDDPQGGATYLYHRKCYQLVLLNTHTCTEKRSVWKAQQHAYICGYYVQGLCLIVVTTVHVLSSIKESVIKCNITSASFVLDVTVFCDVDGCFEDVVEGICGVVCAVVDCFTVVVGGGTVL